MSEAASAPAVKVVSTNRKATHDYEILDRYEAGIVLQGSEIKSIREGKVQFADAYVFIREHEAFELNLHIAEYGPASIWNHVPTRERKLLLKKQEIEKMRRRVEERGMALVPLKLYFKGSRLKLEVGLGRGRKAHDKRDALAEKQAKRDMDRAKKGARE